MQIRFGLREHMLLRFRPDRIKNNFMAVLVKLIYTKITGKFPHMFALQCRFPLSFLISH